MLLENLYRFIWIFFTKELFVSGSVISVSTPNQQSYKILSTHGIPLSGNSIRFNVKACNDVHFALINGHTEQDQLYEIVIGGWGGYKSVIRTKKQGTPVKTANHSQKIVDCKTYKQFWITWDVLQIAVGGGSAIGQNTFLDWTSNTQLVPIQDGGFYTAFGSTGEWVFQITDKITTEATDTTDTCTCPCSRVSKYSYLAAMNLTIKELKDILLEDMIKTKQAISVDKTTLSIIRRSKMSAQDDRKSSGIMGMFAIIFIVLPIALAIISDCSSFFR